MHTLLLIIVSLLLTPTSTEITFVTEDGVTIFGDVYKTDEWRTSPVVLLFHQGGSNARAEYATIIPVLRQQGYSVIAIDQRRGGSRLGGTNRTVDKLEAAGFTYCDAYPDLQSTLAYAVESGFDGQIIVWGSSYSATLAIQLASRYSEIIDAVLAFSPAAGEPLEGCNPELFLDELTVPLLALRPASEMEIESVNNQLKMIRELGHATFVAENGVHGSSMLNPQRTKSPTDDTWKVVLEFISRAIED
ncbi:MAG: alpha/beta fold hydrolase [Rhodothermales bacterium]|nr:alpha/beta fold hydrolase [Rhodothermales bacterium]